MYTAILLDKTSRDLLKTKFKNIIPEKWKIYAHHMTINMGSIKNGPIAENLLGKKTHMTVITAAMDKNVIAVGVKTDILSNNFIKHITIATNIKNGAKPSMSNRLTKWENLTNTFKIYGTIQEIGN